jgi:acetyltransferase-like isoleucine patch superfamily enzyme
MLKVERAMDLRIAKRLAAFIFGLLARPGRHGSTFARINGLTRFNRGTTLSDNFNTNGLRVFGEGTCRFGANFHSGSNVKIYTSSHNYNGSMVPYDRSLINYSVVIEDQVWFGSDVIVVGNVTVGEGAIIQAGSVVSSSIPKYGIAGGNPAVVFKMRDAAVYEQNKQAGRFH